MLHTLVPPLGLREERDLLRREVAEQRRLLKTCVEEVFSLKEELSQLMTSLGPAAAAERQQRLCERLARHVSQIEREVAEKGARAEQWRAERERREAELEELERRLERQEQEAARNSAELRQACGAAEKQVSNGDDTTTDNDDYSIYGGGNMRISSFGSNAELVMGSKFRHDAQW